MRKEGGSVEQECPEYIDAVCLISPAECAHFTRLYVTSICRGAKDKQYLAAVSEASSNRMFSYRFLAESKQFSHLRAMPTLSFVMFLFGVIYCSSLFLPFFKGVRDKGKSAVPTIFHGRVFTTVPSFGGLLLYAVDVQLRCDQNWTNCMGTWGDTKWARGNLNGDVWYQIGTQLPYDWSRNLEMGILGTLLPQIGGWWLGRSALMYSSGKRALCPQPSVLLLMYRVF